jgi:hypothetical protein
MNAIAFPTTLLRLSGVIALPARRPFLEHDKAYDVACNVDQP